MSRVRTDPLVAALTHPTRQGAYQALSQRDEMRTVQLQEALNVDRYNLYHHLKRLVKVGLIENHRDVGRARWWRVVKHVSLPTMGGGTTTQSTTTPFDELSKLNHVQRGDSVSLHNPCPTNRIWSVRKGLSEYPLKRIYNFKGLSVRPSERYRLNQ